MVARPRDAAVFVDDDGYMVVALPKLGQQGIQALAFGDVDGRPQQVANTQGVTRATLTKMRQHVLRQQYANDLVAVLADDRKAGVAGVDEWS